MLALLLRFAVLGAKRERGRAAPSQSGRPAPALHPRGALILNMSQDPVLTEVLQAARLWPVWLRLGLRDIRTRFRRSTAGIGWIFINLAVSLSAIGVVYGVLLGQHLERFLPFLTIGLVMWGYLTSSVLEGGNAFIASEGYIKQIGLPVYIYILRSFVSISLRMLLGLLVYPFVAYLYKVECYWGTLWIVPGLLLFGTTSLLLITIFAHINARFRDVPHMAVGALQILFYVTPVIWPPELLRNRGLPWLVDCNPLYHLLEVVRQPLLHAQAAALFHYQVVGVFLVGLAMIAATVVCRYHRRLIYFL